MMIKNKPLIMFLSAILVVIIVAVGGIFLIRNFQGMRIKVNFSDAKGLHLESPIEFKGVSIGSVLEISADPRRNVSVSIKIDSKHSEHVRKNALFVISPDVSTSRSPGIMIGYCKEVDPYSFPKMASGSVVNGENSELVFLVKTQVGCFNQTTDNLIKALESLKSSIDSILNSPKAKKLYEDIENIFIDLNKNTQEQIKNFIKEKGPEIRKKIEDLIEELERLGHKNEAEKWKNFVKEELQNET